MIAPMKSDEELAVYASGSEYPSLSSSKPCFTRFRLFSGLLAVGAVVAISVATGVIRFPAKAEIDTDDFDIFDPSTWIPRWLDDNPHGGDSPFDFNTWDTQQSCTGLHLRIIDNLEDKWRPYFQRSIEEWESGNPDVLNLRVSMIDFPDPACEHSDGAMKVCNGNYGETDWVGINLVRIQYDHIISSIAKLNDYYLDGMSSAARQNTMCHELGHGFGLGHWDENHYNADLGNCMDYTNLPQNNMSPDHTNFVFLERMYGNTDGSSSYSVNATEGLHCTSTTAEFSKIFKTNEPVRRKLDETGKRTLLNGRKEIREQHLGDGVKEISIIHRP